jgi:hypothetical protein
MYESVFSLFAVPDIETAKVGRNCFQESVSEIPISDRDCWETNFSP